MSAATTEEADTLPPEPPPTRKRRRRLRFALCTCAVLLAWLAVDYYAYPYRSYRNAPTANRGENGLWLRYTWYFGQKSDAEVADLARRLLRNQIRCAYFHVRYIQKDGSLQFRCPGPARKLTDSLHRQAPGVRLIAYAYAANDRGEGPDVDLTVHSVRARMVREAVWLTKECGFDGVQWDYEMCADGEPGYLDLLAETRAAFPPGKMLSVATPVWYPGPLGRLGWSEDYFAEVSKNCDQIAVMVYDTGFWLPRSYAWLAHQNAVHVTRAVARRNRSCQVLLGIPTYGKGLPSHNPRAENIAVALKGVREGLADPAAAPSVFAGVALFADYTTDEAEWDEYRELWLER